MADPTTTATASPPTGDDLVDALTSGYKWNVGPDRTIDWSISGGVSGEQWVDANATRTVMQAALDIISSYIDLKFNYVGAFNDPDSAARAGSEINLFMDSQNAIFDAEEDKNVYAAALPPSDRAGIAAGDIILNLGGKGATLKDFSPGSLGFETLLHEISHALGLKHPHKEKDSDKPNAIPSANPSFADVDAEKMDVNYYTVMSYNDYHSDVHGERHAATPMVLDVLALQSMYGVNRSSNAGNTSIVLKDTRLFQTIWDASGIDVVDVSTATEGWHIEMPWAFYSDNVLHPAGMAAPESDMTEPEPTTIYWLMGFIEGVYGSNHDDHIYGNPGANVILGGGGADRIDGELGDDYIRGEDGADSIVGGGGFDDINGNRGNDSVRGGEGNDWVVGGQDQDLLFGENGNDIVYGNLGNDTLYGGSGDDWVRGGQGEDVIDAGDGADFISGDRGDDTITGGAGADRFNLVLGSGIDRVTDFKTAEGDRVSIEGNLPYTLTFSGGDTIIETSAGDRMILSGVSNATQLGAWLWTG